MPTPNVQAQNQHVSVRAPRRVALPLTTPPEMDNSRPGGQDTTHLPETRHVLCMSTDCRHHLPIVLPLRVDPWRSTHNHLEPAIRHPRLQPDHTRPSAPRATLPASLHPAIDPRHLAASRAHGVALPTTPGAVHRQSSAPRILPRYRLHQTPEQLKLLRLLSSELMRPRTTPVRLPQHTPFQRPIAPPRAGRATRGQATQMDPHDRRVVGRHVLQAGVKRPAAWRSRPLPRKARVALGPPGPPPREARRSPRPPPNILYGGWIRRRDGGDGHGLPPRVGGREATLSVGGAPRAELVREVATADVGPGRATAIGAGTAGSPRVLLGRKRCQGGARRGLRDAPEHVPDTEGEGAPGFPGGRG